MKIIIYRYIYNTIRYSCEEKRIPIYMGVNCIYADIKSLIWSRIHYHNAYAACRKSAKMYVQILFTIQLIYCV